MAQGPSDTILVAIRITLRIREFKVRNRILRISRGLCSLSIDFLFFNMEPIHHLGFTVYIFGPFTKSIWWSLSLHKIQLKTKEQFLADRTIGRAFGTMCRLSVCRLSVTFCIVAKRYVLAKICLKERIGNQGQKVDFLGHRHISTSGFTATAVFALFLPIQPSNRYQMVEIDFLAANHVRIVGLCVHLNKL